MYRFSLDDFLPIVQKLEMPVNPEALKLLDIHYNSFFAAQPYAEKYEHPHPVDTRGWSQILVSSLTGTHGIARKKGADLADGSDVKGASTWGAIDTPRFNGVIKAGTKSTKSGRLESLDEMPFLYFVMWDHKGINRYPRCRVWAVRTRHDAVFRKICSDWYAKHEKGEIESNNFQLHPPRNLDTNVFRNTCGNLSYPLYFSGIRTANNYTCEFYDPSVLVSGQCASA